MLAGAAAGLAGSIAVALSNALLDKVVSPEQRARDRAIREGSGHEVVAKKLARRLGGDPPSALARAAAGAIFGTAFGVGWGILYAALRRRVPAVARAGGIAFAVPFFAVCDGVVAPLLGLSPSPRHVPWQLNAKELANHVVWTGTTEVVHRAISERCAAPSEAARL
jgi:putative membrane protein